MTKSLAGKPPERCTDPRCRSHQAGVKPRFKATDEGWWCHHCCEVIPYRGRRLKVTAVIHEHAMREQIEQDRGAEQQTDVDELGQRLVLSQPIVDRLQHAPSRRVRTRRRPTAAQSIEARAGAIQRRAFSAGRRGVRNEDGAATPCVAAPYRVRGEAKSGAQCLPSSSTQT